MLKAAHDKMLVLGLNPRELEHLKQGQPLTLRLDDVGYPGATVVIFVGESDQKMAEQLQSVNARKRLEEMFDAGEKGLIDLSKIRSN